MSRIDIKSSGQLEMYALGALSDEDNRAVEAALNSDPSLRQELYEVELALESYAMMHALPVDPTAKPMLLAVANFQERMNSGELPSSPPALNAASRISDFAPWLDRTDLQEPSEYESMYGHIIGADETKSTLIVWLKEGAPDETHTDEYEKFLVVEGTCEITIGDTVHSLKSGDFLSIPLHISHRVEVTSHLRCKVILERAAA